MNMPPRVHPTGASFNVAEDQLKQALQQQQAIAMQRGTTQLPQAMAAAGEMVQAQQAAASQSQLQAAQQLNQTIGDLKYRTLQFDPQSLDGTRAMDAMVQELGTADPGAIARRIGMSIG